MHKRKPRRSPLSKRQKVLAFVMVIAFAPLLVLGAFMGPDKTWRPPAQKRNATPRRAAFLIHIQAD